MRQLKRIALIFFVAPILCAQTSRFPPINLYTGDPTGTACTVPNGMVQSSTTGGIYSCVGGYYVSTSNLASPGPIGGTTPGMGHFTKATTSLSPVADVTSPVYGAVSGMTDAAPAVRAAKNALLTAGGGTLYIPKGTWNFTTPDTDAGSYVNITGSHVHVVCAPGAVINSSSSLVTLFRLGQLTGGMVGVQNKAGFQANVLTAAGSHTITLTTPADTSNFSVGSVIYILGGPSQEANGDGEINWVTAINAGTGVLTLRKPTSKPYTGNVSNIGAPNIVTVMNGDGEFFEDLSIEGCTANPGADFAYIGQVIGAKILNNRVVVSPTSTRGMIVNSYYPMADIEIAGNSYTQGGNITSELADGWRDIYIHDNAFTSPYGWPVLLVDQGAMDVIISHNTFNFSTPAGFAGALSYGIGIADSYQIKVDGNIFMVANDSVGGAYAVSTGQSNGTCKNCTVSNNTILSNSTTAAGGGILNFGGGGTVITGNKVTIVGARFGIQTGAQSGLSYAQSLIVGNQVTMRGTGSTAVGIWVAGLVGNIPNQAQTQANNNFIQFDTGALGTAMMFTAAGGGDMSHNYILGAPTAFLNTSGTSIGTPQMVGNVCSNVTTTTGCQIVGDLGAQKFTGAVTMAALAAPALSTPVAVTSGGTLADSTQYCYQIQARNASGYSATQTEKCVTTAGTSGGINSIIVSWGAVPGATTYAVYGRTTAAEAHMSPDLNFSNTTFVDTGSITPSGATQAAMTPAPIVLGTSTANLYSPSSGVVKTDGTFDTATTVNSKLICVADGTNCPASSASTAVPGWLNYLGDGSDGAVTCTTSIPNGTENMFSSLTINGGQTCKVPPRGNIIRVTGACTINGTLDASAVAVGTTSIAAAGGSGGGGGGGAAAGAAGATSAYGSQNTPAQGTPGAISGGNAGSGTSQVARAVLGFANSGITADYAWGGGGGGAGGSAGGAAGNGGEFVILACGSLTGTGTIRADGGYGSPSTANSTGAGGGGGGGVIITRSALDTSTLTLITNGGPGGSNVVPMAQWYGGGNAGLTTTATVTTGSISACSVGGTTTNWLAAPNCAIVGGGGTLATCHFTTSGSSPTLTITGCVVDNAGSGYTQSTWTTSGTGGNGGAGWSKQFTH